MKEWAIGLLFSLFVGWIVTWLFLKVLGYWLGTSPKSRLSSASKEVPPWLTGAIARLFLTVLIGLEVSGASTLVVGWLALNWHVLQDITVASFNSIPQAVCSALGRRYAANRW